ncbi:MAG TPA: rRNA adenine N-6-methyltransferase family protein [Ruania sp.]|nr:rRNA adenine N-6-methyltransferase family protein [Ruania sp.]
MSGSGQRRWGWHRLRPSWADRVVRAAEVCPGETVLDLGAGTGALTRPLAAGAGHVLAVELHPRRTEQLREAMARHRVVTVVQADVLQVPLPRRRFRVVANPPYTIAAELLRRLTARDVALMRADLVLPRWMVQRYLRRPPRGFRAELGLHLPASAFAPAPRGDSAVLVLHRARPLPRPDRRRRSRGGRSRGAGSRGGRAPGGPG